MNIDRYTKTVLTVIAACLVWLCLRDVDFVTSANAQEEAAPRPPIKVEVVNAAEMPVKVEIVEAGDDFDEYIPVIIRGLELDPDDADGSLPVQLKSIKDNLHNRVPVSTQ